MSNCDSCLTAAYDEGAEGFEDQALALMGGDIADHLCDETETDGEIRCDCTCTSPVKSRRLASERKARKAERASEGREREFLARQERANAGVAGGSAAPATRQGDDQRELTLRYR